MEKRILVAEDALTTRMLLMQLLERWEFEVVECRDGEQALELLSAPDAPQVALLDWLMPGYDGDEVCRRIRELEEERAEDQPAWLILLTSLDSKANVVKGLKAGASDYLTKPFHPGELKARIEVGLRVTQLQQSLMKRIRERNEAQAHVRTLQGILPICMHCHSMMDDEKSWVRLEQYLSAHTEVKLSHGLCPTCFESEMTQLGQDAAAMGNTGGTT